MAAVTPVSANGCVGSYEDGTPNIQQKCLKSDDTITCTTWKYFLVQCPKINQQCSSQSGAWVAAITVCNQALF